MKSTCGIGIFALCFTMFAAEHVKVSPEEVLFLAHFNTKAGVETGNVDELVNNTAGHYVSEVFVSLIASGQIIQKTINGKQVYRTVMRCELPALRRKHVISSPDTPELF